uniref:Alpha-amylase inhibitor AAI n=5 Tax=Amaranthaceae TaxID=3563 RepID=IAAI_AMAHP|nr:RecName: Full=Alpha-amylase inhibitor AAI [Amaranthus hypochondriacus]1CLV_I Chain I, PROTEIN (ALPHA-AMYLASE INHIBITOR) [synthetic construct]1HTX_A Chain A, ALPHA-AMYLASE INHIBITOR AAI [Amaranthus hypochondriacus]1QFD_A Chain A, PROTEIN (ALPHA-AMYLASE INHIBITOR) [Amaranthus hypochondriacus]
CIPKWNRCGPKMDGVPCCEPYTCTSDYYGNCS